MAARVGGEAFALLSTVQAVLESKNVLDVIQEALRRLRLWHPASSVAGHVTFSAWLARRRAADARAEDLI